MFSLRNLGIIIFTLLLVFALGALVPGAVSAAGPSPQSAPIENSVVPAIVQILMIVVLAEGIKSLLKAFTNGQTSLQGKEAAIAYVIVGLIVFAIQTYLLPALPDNLKSATTDILYLAGILIAGSGVFSMTSAFRVK